MDKAAYRNLKIGDAVKIHGNTMRQSQKAYVIDTGWLSNEEFAKSVTVKFMHDGFVKKYGSYKFIQLLTETELAALRLKDVPPVKKPEAKIPRYTKSSITLDMVECIHEISRQVHYLALSMEKLSNLLKEEELNANRNRDAETSNSSK